MSLNHTSRILLVDDDTHLLQGCQRSLRNHFDVSTACGPTEALDVLRREGPPAVVVSDLRMPGRIDGIEFLARVRQSCPDTVRMMLTGHADAAAAIEAVNQGHVFRFLTKPCAPEQFADSLQQGLRQHHLQTTRFELLETQLHQAQRMNLAGQCAAGATHSLKCMLTKIRLRAEAAATRPQPHELTDLLAHIRFSAAQASRLTKQLAGLAEERSRSEFRPVFLDHVLHDLGEMLGHVLSRRVEITLRCASGLKPVNADETLLRQALLNLALNARDAMPTGGRLTFDARPVERIRPPHPRRNGTRRYARITISDTGRGMSALTMMKLTEPLFSTKDSGRRLGLGLSVTSEIIRAHDGWILTESERGCGSTFYVFIPEWQSSDGRPGGQRP